MSYKLPFQIIKDADLMCGFDIPKSAWQVLTTSSQALSSIKRHRPTAREPSKVALKVLDHAILDFKDINRLG